MFPTFKFWPINFFIWPFPDREKYLGSIKSGHSWLIFLIKGKFFEVGPTPASFVYFCLFVQKILVASGIRTQIVGVEGKNADH